MKYLSPNRLISIVLLLVLSNWSVAIYASTKPIGKIILAVGEVVATNASGDMRKLKRRSKIFPGDTLTTKPGARCQVRFSDKSLVALPESSIFKVDEYSFTPKGGTKEKAIYSLLRVE